MVLTLLKRLWLTPADLCAARHNCRYRLLISSIILMWIAQFLTMVGALDPAFFLARTCNAGEETKSVGVGLWTMHIWEGNDYYEIWDGRCWPFGFDSPERRLALRGMLDDPLKAARVYGALSILFSQTASRIIRCPLYDHVGKSKRRVFAFWMTLLCVASGVTTLGDFVALTSHYCIGATSCTLYYAGYCAIVASVLWFVSAAMMYIAYQKPHLIGGI